MTRLPPGAEVRRIPSREEGDLLAVARTSGADPVLTAYVTAAGSTRYLVVGSISDDAPALDRLEAESLLRSFEPRA